MASAARPEREVRAASILVPSVHNARSRRVALLLIAVVMVSLADLIMTLLFLLNWGMSEGNPLARAIMSYNSPELVVAWKFLTVGFASWVLWKFRRNWAAEAGAWFAFALMVWLSFQWSGYLGQMELIMTEADGGEITTPAAWVTMAEVPAAG